MLLVLVIWTSRANEQTNKQKTQKNLNVSGILVPWLAFLGVLQSVLKETSGTKEQRGAELLRSALPCQHCV